MVVNRNVGFASTLKLLTLTGIYIFLVLIINKI